MRKELNKPVRVNVILESSEWEDYKRKAKLSLSRLIRKSMKVYLDNLARKR